MLAINPKWEKLAAKVWRLNRDYEEAVNAGRATEGRYNRLREAWDELPKREQARLNTLHKKEFGYPIF